MPGQTMPNLIGSSMHQPSGRPSKPCQLSPGCRTQQFGSVASISSGASWNGMRLPLAGSRTSSAFHGAKNHSFFALNSCRARATREPAGDRLVDGLLRERLARRAVHHRGRDVVRCDQRIERRGARLRAVRLVEAPVIDGAAAVADVDVGGLRQRGEQLVRRVRRKHRRAVLRVRRRDRRAWRSDRGTSG